MDQDIDIPFENTDTLRGEFPYRLTHDDRFQYRAKVKVVAGDFKVSVRPVDTRLAALAARRQWEGMPIRGKTSTIAKDPQDSIRRAAWRAREKIGDLAGEMRVDRLLTFTIRYVGYNMEYDRVLKAWDLFRRMSERFDKNFRYLAVPEKQKNGQWHIHAGVHGYVRVEILTRMWQSALNRVMGRHQSLVHKEDSPGTCNLRKEKPGQRQYRDPKRRAKAIANYISKYIAKTLEGEFNRKKYFHSTGIHLMPARRYWLEAQNRESALLEVFRMLGYLDEANGVLDAMGINPWRRSDVSVYFEAPPPSIPF